jgi:hypothetical protein
MEGSRALAHYCQTNCTCLNTLACTGLPELTQSLPVKQSQAGAYAVLLDMETHNSSASQTPGCSMSTNQQGTQRQYALPSPTGQVVLSISTIPGLANHTAVHDTCPGSCTDWTAFC